MQGRNAPSISTKILFILVVSLLVIEAILLVFSVWRRESELIEHYLFEARIVARAVDIDRIPDADYRRALERRLADVNILGVSSYGDVQGEESYLREGDRLLYRVDGLELAVDVSAIPEELVAYAWRITGLTVIIVFFMVASSFTFLSVHLVRPLQALLRNLEAISGRGGDLTQRLSIRSTDEIGRLAGAFNRFTDQILTIVDRMKTTAAESTEATATLLEQTRTSSEHLSRVADSTQTVRRNTELMSHDLQDSATSVHQISASVGSLSASVQKQAGSVDSSMAAIEEMNASVHSLSQLAQQNKQSTESVIGTAQDGLAKMDEAVSSMRDIESSTSQILETIDVINGIAEQTDLLAMNAAIEAAHAGEFGKGFAVVADEIRKLAELTGENARMITENLAGEVDRIRAAGESNRGASDAFESIVAGVKDVGAAIREMVSGMAEQSRASRELVEAIEQISDMTGHIRGAAEEIDTSTSEVSSRVTSVSEVSKRVSAEMNEAAAAIQSINGAVGLIEELGRRTMDAVSAVDEEIAGLRTSTEERHSESR